MEKSFYALSLARRLVTRFQVWGQYTFLGRKIFVLFETNFSDYNKIWGRGKKRFGRHRPAMPPVATVLLTIDIDFIYQGN